MSPFHSIVGCLKAVAHVVLGVHRKDMFQSCEAWASSQPRSIRLVSDLAFDLDFSSRLLKLEEGTIRLFRTLA